MACNTRQIRLFPHKPFNLIAGGENVEKSESTKNHHFEASRMDLQASPVRRRFRMWRRKYVLGPSWTSDEKSFLCWSVTQHRCNVYVQKGTLEKINWTLPLVQYRTCMYKFIADCHVPCEQVLRTSYRRWVTSCCWVGWIDNFCALWLMERSCAKRKQFTCDFISEFLFLSTFVPLRCEAIAWKCFFKCQKMIVPWDSWWFAILTVDEIDPYWIIHINNGSNRLQVFIIGFDCCFTHPTEKIK